MHPAMISDPAARRAFVLGGDAKFTVVGRSNRFTYRVRRAAPRLGQAPEMAPWFVDVLVGPDNGGDFAPLGVAFPVVNNGWPLYRRQSKSTVGELAPSAVAFAWFWRHVDDLEKHGAEFWHSGACSRCGRELTTPESLERGLGPTCAGKAA